MKALLIVAHGSRQPEANQEIQELARRVRALVPDGLDRIECAFLQMGEPSVEQGLEELVRTGCREIVLFPYFTAAGTHVLNDLPRLIKRATAHHPGTTIRMSSHLAAIPGLERLILEHVQNCC